MISKLIIEETKALLFDPYIIRLENKKKKLQDISGFFRPIKNKSIKNKPIKKQIKENK